MERGLNLPLYPDAWGSAGIYTPAPENGEDAHSSAAPIVEGEGCREGKREGAREEWKAMRPESRSLERRRSRRRRRKRRVRTHTEQTPN